MKQKDNNIFPHFFLITKLYKLKGLKFPMEKFVVKRKGHNESFDEKKLYASVYSATLNCHHSEERAEEVAQHTLDLIHNWIKDHPTITSHILKLRVIRELKNIDRDIAMMYEVHMDIC